MSKILIIGGGAAGMMAGVYLARAGHEVHILEKNRETWKESVYYRKRQMQCYK